jgi:hypothetical protein
LLQVAAILLAQQLLRHPKPADPRITYRNLVGGDRIMAAASHHPWASYHGKERPTEHT